MEGTSQKSSTQKDFGESFTLYTGKKNDVDNEQAIPTVERLKTFSQDWFVQAPHSEKSLFFFKKDIKPRWEDEANKNGAQLSFRHDKIMDMWEKISTTFSTQHCEAIENICGLVLRIYEGKNIWIRIWAKPLDKRQQEVIFEWIRSTVGVKVIRIVPNRDAQDDQGLVHEMEYNEIGGWKVKKIIPK